MSQFTFLTSIKVRFCFKHFVLDLLGWLRGRPMTSLRSILDPLRTGTLRWGKEPSDSNNSTTRTSRHAYHWSYRLAFIFILIDFF